MQKVREFLSQAWILIWWLFLFVAGSAVILIMAIKVGNCLARIYGDGKAAADLSGWVQAVGAVFAIVAGFTATAWQLSRQRNDALAAEAASGQAALLLAHDALDAVSERLDAVLTPDLQLKDLGLRGARTNELVEAMREFDLARAPSTMLPDFVRLRSHVAAVNARIGEIYKSEASGYTGKVRKRSERNNRLESAVNKRNESLAYYENLQSIASRNYKAKAIPLTEYRRITDYRLNA